MTGIREGENPARVHTPIAEAQTDAPAGTAPDVPGQAGNPGLFFQQRRWYECSSSAAVGSRGRPLE